MKIVVAALSVAVLFGLGFALGSFEAGRFMMSSILPYFALLLFAVGSVYRVVHWASSPVPFRIPTTCGQQKSLPWIKPSAIDNPSTRSGAIARMAIELFLFRSLFRNTKAEHAGGGNDGESKLVFTPVVGLWFFALLFHGCLFVILVRHLRFFTDPIPSAVTLLTALDGWFSIATPSFYFTGGLFLASALYLWSRRALSPRVRYLSLVSDHFFILLLFAVGLTGVWLRHISKTDVVAVKEMAVGLASFAPRNPKDISALFYAHFFLVLVIFSLFPFSKLVHGIGLIFSPTRNMRANSRAFRHINPWNDPSIKPRSYEEYEDEFRDKMKAAGIPVEKE